MTIKETGPYIALVTGIIGVVLYVDRRDSRIEAETHGKTTVALAISGLQSEVEKMSETFRQSIQSLEGQQWTDHGRMDTRMTKIEDAYYVLEEEIDELRLSIANAEIARLKEENARLRAMQ